MTKECVFCKGCFTEECNDSLIRDELKVFNSGDMYIGVDIFIEDNQLELYLDDPAGDAILKRKVKIKYCPMCRRRLLEKDDIYLMDFAYDKGELPVRTCTSLVYAGYLTLKDVANATKSEINKIPSVGIKSEGFKSLEKILEKHGLTFKDEKNNAESVIKRVEKRVVDAIIEAESEGNT